MNRLWIGIGLLVLLLGLGVALWLGSGAFFGEFSHEMEAAGQAALESNWVLAGEKAAECERKWTRFAHFWSAFTDHAPMEQVQSLLSQLELYKNARLEVDFAACCRCLAREAEAIRENHGLAWWSIL